MAAMSNTKTMNVIVSQIDAAIFDGASSGVTAPGVEGALTILPEHEAFITPLTEGTLYIETPEKTHEIPITKGLMEVSNNQVSILI